MLHFLKPILMVIALMSGGALLATYAHAQNNQPSEPYVVDRVDCNSEEHAKSLLDHAAVSAGTDSSLIIIARLGRGETSQQLIRRRLAAPSSYLVAQRGIPKTRVITATGERVSGPGRVEVYVAGKLFITFKMKRNRDFGPGPRCKIAFD